MAFQSLFKARPFLVGGGGYSCIGKDGRVSPFYLQVITQDSEIENATKQVSLTVRPAHYSEMISGNAHLEAPLRTHPIHSNGRRSNLAEGSTPTVQLPPSGCVYPTKCYAIPEIWAKEASGNSVCPSGYPNINPLSLSTKWNKHGNYKKSGTTHNIDTPVSITGNSVPSASATASLNGYFKSTGSGDIRTCSQVVPVEIPIPCTPATCALGTGIDCRTTSVFSVTTTMCQKQSVDVDAGIDSYRFHCCDSSYADKIPMEYQHTTNMAMDYSTGLIGGSILNSQNTASMNMQAVLDVEFSAEKYSQAMGNINIPNGAYLGSATANAKL